jgi:hypothetical protein
MSIPSGPVASKASESRGVQATEGDLTLLQLRIEGGAGASLNLKRLSKALGFATLEGRDLGSLIDASLMKQDDRIDRSGLGQLASELGLPALGTLSRDKIGRSAVVNLRTDKVDSAYLVVRKVTDRRSPAIEPRFILETTECITDFTAGGWQRP